MDSSLFIFRQLSLIIWVLIYVDDILISGSDSSAITRFIAQLNSLFSLKDLGPLSFSLGIKVYGNSTGLYLSQAKYIRELLAKTSMLECKTSPTPASTSVQLGKDIGASFSDKLLYRSTIGTLQYLLLTRPDLAFIINKLSQFMQAPTEVHWAACKCVLHYLKGTIQLGLHIRSSLRSSLYGYTDANWASNVDDRRSTGGCCVYLNDNLVSWSSRKQHVVARSSMESEYRALAHGIDELAWIQSLLNELCVPVSHPPILLCDNMSARSLASNPVFHVRTKHIEIDVHFVRDKVFQQLLQVNYFHSTGQVANIFTKVLSIEGICFSEIN
ncbi:uncharacterized mitochondrial protein AtMg00810-like [Ziziphus jujuba]|uniref:Uncharacterized mitochondrial protein AtMg00810-like n=1 Tax=Ziziphus jujuba TaxID=326968 RepID=A0ABM4A7S1_ZIZJJ|nr:uncharacterized mitochondrial protein AtMg00810-like [Ziziphus jujuba]